MSAMMTTIRLVSMAQAVVGVASIVVGSLTLYYGSPDLAFPMSSGVGIWGGLLILLSGILGILASFCSDVTSLKFRGLYKGHYACNNVSISGAVQMVAYSAIIYVNCNKLPVGSSYCSPNINENVVMAIVGIVTGCVMCFLTAVGMAAFCMFRRTMITGKDAGGPKR